jgi:hypothetical protein
MKLGIQIAFGVLILILLSGLTSADESGLDKDTYSFTAIIPIGGHTISPDFRLYDGDKIQARAKVTSGGPVDIYLMTENQYERAYDAENGSLEVISYIRAQENTKEAEIIFKVPSEEDDDGSYDYFEPYDYKNIFYIVVDNRNHTLTLHDANATGPVEVNVEIIIDRKEFNIDFPNFYDTGLVVCVIGGFVGAIVIIIIIILVTRNKGQRPQQPQYYAYPYPYWPPPPEEFSIEDEFKKPKSRRRKKSSRIKDDEI